MRAWQLKLLAACTLLLAFPSIPVWAGSPAATRPKVALVLSGGGARGFAHVGVLRALDRLRVPVDIVVGTSMGSVVGGAWAAGVSLEHLERIVRETDWERVVADRSARDDLSFRRREEDVLLPSRIELGVSKSGVTLPPSMAGNAALETALESLLPSEARDTPVNYLPLPFRSVASDLVSGELVELSDTPLFMAIRASLAVPGVFAPVRLKGRLLVDGGLVRNLPIDLAHKMGADIVIAVNVGTPLAPESELQSAVGVAQQMLQILTEQNVQRSLKELGPQDILVSPNLSGIGFLDFKRHEQAMRAGLDTTLALADKLAPLALDAQAYAATEARRAALPEQEDSPLPLATFTIQHEGKTNPDVLREHSGLTQGAPVTLKEVRGAVGTLLGRGDLARVETEVFDNDGQRNVTIKSSEDTWINNRLRIGLELGSDFSDSNQFALKLMHVRSSLNSWGAELRSNGQIGSARGLKVEFWQPLGPGSRWNLASWAEIVSSAADGYQDGMRLYRRAYRQRTAGTSLGLGLGNWGEARAGLARTRIDAHFAIPSQPGLGEDRLHDTTRFMNWRVDSLDSLAFPTKGFLLNARWEQSRAAADGRPSLARSFATGLTAFKLEKWAGHVYGEWARAESGAAPLSLGGFLRLSGEPDGSVQGRSVALARLVLARHIGVLPSVLGGAVRFGFSAEAGGGYDHAQPLHGASFKLAASTFIAVDTRFGPLYLGAGATRHGSGTLYLYLGPIW